MAGGQLEKFVIVLTCLTRSRQLRAAKKWPRQKEEVEPSMLGPVEPQSSRSQASSRLSGRERDSDSELDSDSETQDIVRHSSQANKAASANHKAPTGKIKTQFEKLDSIGSVEFG